GTRADYGLMRHTLATISAAPDLKLQLLVTGMHLDPKYGHTVDEIAEDKFEIAALVPTDVRESSGKSMARAIGEMIVAFSEIMSINRPDIVLLLGDRGEMLAGAIAAIHLNIPIAHIHGGERSGTVDEPVRHAISKLSHFHFVATKEAHNRLSRMGENPEHIHVVGAPGIDGIQALATWSRSQLTEELNLNPVLPIALMVFHPVLQEQVAGAANATTIIRQLCAKGVQIVALMPNADSGSDDIREILYKASQSGEVKLVTHFPRNKFVSWMAAADLMIGNSSAGIIEAASFGTPVVNIGNRQNLRERNGNVIDAPAEPLAIAKAIGTALAIHRFEPHNTYGDGNAANRITNLLRTVSIGSDVMDKCCAY
ncbi:MAG: UDP-N-acetylglucosamine 2-epimerase, partial [Sphingorhabdus sp.]